MSQKAICPRGHVWDPATLAGLPASDAPRCPVCGEVEAVRKRDTLGRLWRWCRKNPALAILSALCLLLTIALIAAGGGWLSASRAVEAANSRRESAGETRTIPSAPSVRTAPQTALVEANWKQKLDSVRNQLAEAERLRRDALQQRDEQVVARRNAEELARTAEQVRQEAVDLRRQTDRQLIGMHVAAGTRFMEQGDLSSSLLWFVEALRLAQREKMPEETHRLRLAAVLAPCARPVRMWMHEGKWKAVHPSGDGRRLLAVGADSSLRLFDAATGERVGDPLAHDSKIVAAALSPGGKRAAKSYSRPCSEKVRCWVWRSARTAGASSPSASNRRNPRPKWNYSFGTRRTAMPSPSKRWAAKSARVRPRSVPTVKKC
jgi:hypothetical protein